jgi:uncharacterized RmlC-like cupin family protein
MADIHVIPASERSANTAQTPGLERFEAISASLTGSEKLWMGFSVMPPGAKIGKHHHGESETAIYVLRGIGRWWVGPRRDRVHEVRAGDFLFIPPNVVHWEENASSTEPVEMIVARSTQEAIVVNLEVHHLETPSPLTIGGFKGVGEAAWPEPRRR